MNAIRIRSEADFERLRDRIDLESSHACHHWELLQALRNAAREYPIEMNQSNTFWYLTLLAHKDSVLLRLCRLYDKDGGALSLTRFLLTVRANPSLFSEAAFRIRLNGKPHMENLMVGRIVDDDQLSRDLESVSGSDPSVARLWNMRNKIISHTDAEIVRIDAEDPAFTPEDEQELLERARHITLKYSFSFRASAYGGIAGHDDFRYTLQLVGSALATQREKTENEIAAARRWSSSVDPARVA